MKAVSTMLVVRDMDRSVEFYKAVLGRKILSDFGANKTLTGGLALQTLDSYRNFIETDRVSFGGNQFELYFEADDFDAFIKKLRKHRIEYVHPRQGAQLGAAVSSVFTIPTGISLKSEKGWNPFAGVLSPGGLTPEQTATRMDVPLDYVNRLIK